MSAPIDVLAVLDSLAVGYLRNEGTPYAFVTCRTDTKPSDGTEVGDAWGRIREARDAVAELIAAAESLFTHEHILEGQMDRLGNALIRAGAP